MEKMDFNLAIYDDGEEVNFTVESEFTGERSPHNNNAFSGNKVTVTRGEESTQFDFYGSIVEPELAEEGIPFAMYCFLSDSISGMMSPFEFMQEFGYDAKEGERIYKACEKQYAKYEKLFSDIDIYDFTNSFQEKFQDSL